MLEAAKWLFLSSVISMVTLQAIGQNERGFGPEAPEESGE